MKKYVLYILCAVLIFAGHINVFGEETKEIKDSDLISKSAVIIDGETGRVLYGKNYVAGLPKCGE